MASKLVYHIGGIKFSRKENALGKAFARLPYVTTISKMTWSDHYDISERRFETASKYRNGGNAPKAIKYYKKALKANPENELAHLHLGGICRERKEYAEAAKHYVRLIQLGKKMQPESETPADADHAKAIRAEGYDGLGKVFWSIGDYKTGVEMLEKSLETQPSVSRKLALYSFLLSYYNDVGDKEKAERCEAFLNVVD